MLHTENFEHSVNINTEQQRLLQEFRINITTPTSLGGYGIGIPPTPVTTYRVIPESWLENLNIQRKTTPPISEVCLNVLRPEIQEKFLIPHP